MKIMGKNKAPSADGILDIIFQDRAQLKCSWSGYRLSLEELVNKDQLAIDWHLLQVKTILAKNLSKYLNY